MAKLIPAQKIMMTHPRNPRKSLCRNNKVIDRKTTHDVDIHKKGNP
jgi:hypothetical protein